MKEYSNISSYESGKPNDVIELNGSYVEDGADVTGKHFAFILNTKNETVYFLAFSEEEKMKWMQTFGGRLSIMKKGRERKPSISLDIPFSPVELKSPSETSGKVLVSTKHKTQNTKHKHKTQNTKHKQKQK